MDLDARLRETALRLATRLEQSAQRLREIAARLERQPQEPRPQTKERSG